jgi:hypothetical protein
MSLEDEKNIRELRWARAKLEVILERLHELIVRQMAAPEAIDRRSRQ